MTSTSAFIGRQAVLNRNQQLIGYELLFHPSGEASGVGKHTELQADTQVLVNTLNNMGTSWLIGSKLAFINIGEAMLSSEFLELLPPRRVILDISPRIVPSMSCCRARAICARWASAFRWTTSASSRRPQPSWNWPTTSSWTSSTTTPTASRCWRRGCAATR